MYSKHLHSVSWNTVIRRASEVVLVTSGGKWRLARMFKLSKHVCPCFPRGTTKVKMKSCVNCWCDILVPKDTSIVIKLHMWKVYPIA